MSKIENEIKIPTREGLTEARKKLKEMLRQEPSSELVKIIEEVTREKDQSNNNQEDRAARSPDRDLGI